MASLSFTSSPSTIAPMAAPNITPGGIPRSASRQAFHRPSESSSSVSDYQTYQAGMAKNYYNGAESGSGRGKTKWLSQVKNWLSVSEPSAQAMKMQKQETYKKHGVDLKDPAAAAKMHLPLGTLPRDATTSTSGPTPEKRLAKELQSRPQYLKHGSTQSVSSGSSLSTRSIREPNHVAPWDN